MKCSKAVEDYLKLDNNSHTPFVLKLHLMFCKECRNEVIRLKKVFYILKEDAVYKSPYDIRTSVMDIIRSESVYAVKTISAFKWVTIGSIIFFSILLINFSDSFLWLKNEFGSDYTIPMSIVMGFIFSAYSAVLIGCNYESIKKYLELHYRWKIK
jgi:membrane-bound acyltransferase YfiQ involved in biofilm formation